MLEVCEKQLNKRFFLPPHIRLLIRQKYQIFQLVLFFHDVQTEFSAQLLLGFCRQGRHQQILIAQESTHEKSLFDSPLQGPDSRNKNAFIFTFFKIFQLFPLYLLVGLLPTRTQPSVFCF